MEVVEHVPNLRRLEPRGFVGQHIFADVLQELVEDVVERDEIDEVRCVLAIHILDVFDDGLRHVCEVLLVLPEVVEVLEESVTHGRGHPLDELEEVVAAFAAQFRRRELVERHVGEQVVLVFHVEEALHVHLGDVRLEAHLLTDPVGALAGDGALGEVVAQTDFEVRAIERPLAVQFGDVELAFLLVGVLFGEGGRGEDEPQFVHLLKLLLQRLKGIDGKGGGGHGDFRALAEGGFQVVDDAAGGIIELLGQFHRGVPLSLLPKTHKKSGLLPVG